MIDVSNIKAPGWQRVVAELTQPVAGEAADGEFLARLLRVLAQVSAARQAVLWAPDRTDGEEVNPSARATWPPPGMDMNGGAGSKTPTPSNASGTNGVALGATPGGAAITVEQEQEAKEAARAAFGSAQARAFSLEQSSGYYGVSGGGGGEGFVLAVPLRGGLNAPAGGQADDAAGDGAGGGVAGVVTLLVEPRSKDALRSTLAMAEVLSGYLYGHTARQALRKTQAASFALDLATRLIASLNTAPSFKGACIQLCNDLARQFGVDRVALGWVPGYDRGGDAIRVEAMSDVEHFDRRLAMVQKLQAAMEECLDQEQPIVFPPPPEEGPGGDVLLAQAIVHAHRELSTSSASSGGMGGAGGAKVGSMPLRVDEHVVGVLTMESSGAGAVELGAIEMLQAALDLVAPVLKVIKSDDRILAVRVWDSTLKGASWLVGPKHTVWKLAAVALLAVVTVCELWTMPYRVSAEAVLEPRVKRTVSAPYDGVIQRLGERVEAGARVEQGQVLVELDTTELRLGLNDARAKYEQAVTQASAAQKEGDQYKYAQAMKQAERAESEMGMYQERIRRSTITSPIDGVIIQADLEERVGSTIKLGDPLLQIAQMDEILVTMRVDERDIALVLQEMQRREDASGLAGGVIAPKSRPSERAPFDVETVVPLAVTAEGKNVFEVRGRLRTEDLTRAEKSWLQPGVEGISKIKTQRMSLLRIGARRIVDTIRLWLW